MEQHQKELADIVRRRLPQWPIHRNLYCKILLAIVICNAVSRILSISYDLSLLSIRQMLLETQGHKVISAEGFVQALEKCKSGDYDLLIIGHSIPHTDKEALIEETKKRCNAPILSLKRSGEPMPNGATEEVDPTRPDLLLEAVKRLTR